MHIGRQVQARIVNNTIYKCHQGVQITATHNTGECPPEPQGDESTPQGERRNTSVAIINNIFLDTPNDGTNDTHVHTGTGPNSLDEDQPATLTQGEFDYDLHYPEASLYVKLPNGNFCTTLACLEAYYDPEHDMDYAEHSVADMDPDLEDPGALDFHATSGSDFGNLGKPNDSAYGTFQSAWGISIYHDYDGAAYTNPNCSFGAFADPDF